MNLKLDILWLITMVKSTWICTDFTTTWGQICEFLIISCAWYISCDLSFSKTITKITTRHCISDNSKQKTVKVHIPCSHGKRDPHFFIITKQHTQLYTLIIHFMSACMHVYYMFTTSRRLIIHYKTQNHRTYMYLTNYLTHEG